MLVAMVLVLFASQALCVEATRGLRVSRDEDPVIDDFAWDLLTETTGVDAGDHLEKPGEGGPESFACTEASYSMTRAVLIANRKRRNPAPTDSIVLPRYQPGPNSPTTPETSPSRVEDAAQRPRVPVGRLEKHPIRPSQNPDYPCA
ncbi:uncharacterized protein NECHADRAFT_84970 [Fusarium vanettenii 77-13-4]|uniref:Secreted protein n=1 Tax=Fusarium vanettenii (strain ATCC MYA-4622 / CBS 123669 / FGSC 9596 / NRRL 45880 / 77-13-4) TaxID=660122 RepID=C7YUM2_FUSV7|nr:uncharacterized protein NECHADRAFT_84970 [Fusarium vanettenii 77-13-4]EEU44829.1 predicted protein [Fusarium vanettenii 77-13-4]